MQSVIKKVVITSGARYVAPSSIRTMSYQRNYRLVRPPLAIYKRNTALVCVNNATSVRHYASWDKKDPDQNESAMFKKGKEAAEAALNVAQKSTEFMSEAAQKAYAAGTEVVSNMVGSTKAKGAEANQAAERAADKIKHNAEETFSQGKHAAEEAVQQGKHRAQETAKSAEAHVKGASASAKDFVASSKEYVSGAVDAAKDAINKRGDKD